MFMNVMNNGKNKQLATYVSIIVSYVDWVYVGRPVLYAGRYM